jgi:membrane protein DedA with SNARE-associated domain
MKLPSRKFLLFDVIGLVAFTTICLLLGVIFNKSLGAVIEKTKGLQDIIFFGPFSWLPLFWLYLSEIEKEQKGSWPELIKDEILAEKL